MHRAIHKNHQSGFTIIEIMIVVAVIGILVAIAVPGFVNAMSQSRARACQEAQHRTDGAKMEWALANNQVSTATPTWGDLVTNATGDLYLDRTPRCPETGTAIGLTAVRVRSVCPNTIAVHARAD